MRRSPFVPRLVIVMVGILSAAATPRARGQVCSIHERQKLTASDGAEEDQFGRSVSISGEWAFIGAYLDDDAGTDSGSAYVFRRDDNGTPLDPSDDFLVEAVKLTGSDSAFGDRFGFSVSISGDRAIVGAMFDHNPGGGSGSAYAFRRDDNGTPSDTADDFWVEEDKLTASDGEPNDNFGRWVAIDGDRAIVGAPYDDDAGSDSGSAYVFRRDDGGTPLDPSDDVWIEEAKLTASDAAAGDLFGIAVSISSAWLIVGALGDDDMGTSSGSAYVFRHDDNATPLEPDDDFWVEQAKLTAPAGAANDRFGRAVALSGDWAIVGARSNGGVGSDAGSAHVFRRDDAGTPSDPTDDSWIAVQELTAWDAAAGDLFGGAVSISGAWLVVGASSDDDMGFSSGSAYVFRRENNGTPSDPSDDRWVHQAKHTASDGDAFDSAGGAVSISGDRVLVGASGDDDDGQNSGSAYVFAVRLDGAEDCNCNLIADATDIAKGTSDDCNGNDIPDDCELDCNENNVADSCDIAEGTSADCNTNAIPDDCELDCNDNGVPDDCDLVGGTSLDCNANAIPDECETDCNGNGIPDDCDIADATSDDCNANGIPDDCEPDCNENNVADSCDIADGSSQDCSSNGTPDECEPDCNSNGLADSCDIYYGTSDDCTHNGSPDECDIADGTSEDLDGDGVPDECARFRWRPVAASGNVVCLPGEAPCDKNEIMLFGGGVSVTLFLELRGWDRYFVDDPLLGAWQGTVDATTYSGGLAPGDVPGHPGNPGTLPGYNLVPTGQPNMGFEGAFQALKVCTSAPYGCGPEQDLLTNCQSPAQCEVGQLCLDRCDFVYYELGAVCVVSTAVIDYPWMCASLDCAIDDATFKYGGTLLLDVPPHATGTYNVGFYDNRNFTLMNTCIGQEIRALQRT